MHQTHTTDKLIDRITQPYNKYIKTKPSHSDNLISSQTSSSKEKKGRNDKFPTLQFLLLNCERKERLKIKKARERETERKKNKFNNDNEMSEGTGRRRWRRWPWRRRCTGGGATFNRPEFHFAVHAPCPQPFGFPLYILLLSIHLFISILVAPYVCCKRRMNWICDADFNHFLSVSFQMNRQFDLVSTPPFHF